MASFNLILLQDLEEFTARENSSLSTIHTIEKGFVDINLKLDENIDVNILKNNVSFTSGLYTLSEGDISNIYVQLSSPSTLGIEEVDLAYIGSSGLGGAIINQDLAIEGTNFTYPLRLSWGVGDKVKKIPISGFTDYAIESTQDFHFQLIHFVNCKPSNTTSTTIRLSNVDNFPFVYLQPYDASFASTIANPDGTYRLNFSIPENNQIKLRVSLSYPSIYGLEEVDVVFNNQSAKVVDYNIDNPYSPLGVNSESSYTKELNNSDGFVVTKDFSYLSPYDYSTGTYIEYGPAVFPSESINHNYISSVLQDPSNQIQSLIPTKFKSQFSGEYTVFYHGSHTASVDITFGDYIGGNITSIDGSYTMKLLIYKNNSLIKEEELYTKQITGLNANINIPFSVKIATDMSASDELTFKLKCDVSEITIASDYLVSAYLKLRIKTVDSYLDVIKTIGEVIHLKWGVGEQEKIIGFDIVNDGTTEPIETFTIELKNAMYSNIVSNPTSVPFIPTGRFSGAAVQIQS
jgi:hypothetical protein